jgi:hypothetical protein
MLASLGCIVTGTGFAAGGDRCKRTKPQRAQHRFSMVDFIVFSGSLLLLSVLRILRPLLLCEARGTTRALCLYLPDLNRCPRLLFLRPLIRACLAVSRLAHGRASAPESAACVCARAHQESAAGQRRVRPTNASARQGHSTGT